MKNKTIANVSDFDSVFLKLAAPSDILDWSFGEVTKPETINYRTQRSEKNGLFDERIFGPDRDYECYCGKYRGVRYKGIICEKCGVEMTRSIVRRERMGHIELSTPVSHIWFLRSMPSRLGLLLGMSSGDLEKVIYFAGYIITKVDQGERERILRELDGEYKMKVRPLTKDTERENLKERYLTAKKEIEGVREGAVLDEVSFHAYSLRYGTLFEASVGAEAIYALCESIDLPKLQASLETDLEKASSIKRDRLNKRLSLIRSMISANIRPEWMFLTRIPVIPPALRPMVPLDGGRYATSDVNDLYRRVINRNNRLRKLKEINAPDVILRNEKRILQEAVDSLIDNSIRHGAGAAGALTAAQRRPLKSLSDNLKGKRGLFRQNLLGKRVDYSGRSVIVVGPELKLHQCGLPKHMALELFRPFVIAQLLKKELAFNIRGAGRLIEEGVPEVWAILEDVIKDKYVLLNRAPTLHRLGIQAFQPVLIEGNAIQVHPLVCTAFNADFDGDQMAVHVPLSEEAQFEAREIMAAHKNILKPGSGDPIVSAKMLDIVLGCWWMTKAVEGVKGEGKMFARPNNAVTAWDFGEVDFRAKIKVLGTEHTKYKIFDEKVFETTVGRILFNSVLPNDYPYMNKEIERKSMTALIDDLINRYGIGEVPTIMDRIKAFGFKYATYSGITWGIDDVVVPPGKVAVIEEAKGNSEKVYKQWQEGLLSEDERLRKNVEIWHGAKAQVEKLIPASMDPNGSVHDMIYSGARGSFSQITQMAGMKGLIQNTAGETIEFPILSCMKEGLTPIEYFITTHGSRKGLTDTALNTAKAGYLTRKLFVVAQDVMVTEEDCGTKEGIVVTTTSASGIDVQISKNIRGRFLLADVVDVGGQVLFKKGYLLTKLDAIKVQESGVKEVFVRSPLTCKSVSGICQHCYGLDLGKHEVVGLGEAVGTVAAQAIGEPGTQLTMRTFHTGGVSSVGGDITQGLPRVEELFEKRAPKSPAVVARVDGVVSDVRDTGKEKTITILPDIADKVKTTKKKSESEYVTSYNRIPLVKIGDRVKKGDVLTDGAVDIDELFKYGGKKRAQNYIISEVTKPYELQGETVARKHIETIVRQMFFRRKVKESGDTNLSIGDIVDPLTLHRENEEVKAGGGIEAKADFMVMGISEVSLSRKSFLSAASFQHTTRVLINSAVRGSEDKLRGLMENVIIGRLIPAGTGYVGGSKEKLIKELQAQLEPKWKEEATNE
ncbi:MAG: DNA-directed RNA polymerase subunit beta' [Candidatus Taylorbacteria bacterium CG11_big_fil_rev_8_21_14_0_20_46_11]|uniref:DNA-directed RNA polymerase subunit beta' n=1 Tax=Candidatus Taylorbacteria bacterium CG11_big_fil_rev_8_21_14_0_20_46_11 TaxID=1975025 RepID=A0A2H0KAS0_9BACT|nr:MAG: DNA-directed RNA polymerase subunit beta' [Candidatus Taylorbacteria bacterium CG11_big_fil_rev_8_21_14_0_20_46_11]